MKTAFAVAAFGLAAGLAACGAPDLATRQLAAGTGTLTAADMAGDLPVNDEILIAQYAVKEVRVSVPRDLTVSEANLYYPVADIVWRGEPRGDRHAQVQAIVEEAMAKGTRRMHKGPAVVVDVTVRRFHALTEKTRYSFGGVHSIRFDLTVRDAETGRIIEGPRLVVGDVEGAGGKRAIEEEARGLTQRLVIVHNLAHTILRELSLRREPVDNESLARIDDDLRLNLAAVSMKDRGDEIVFSSKARDMIADYAGD